MTETERLRALAAKYRRQPDYSEDLLPEARALADLFDTIAADVGTSSLAFRAALAVADALGIEER